MKLLFTFFICLLTQAVFAQSLKTLHDFKVLSITGDSIDLSMFAGKKVLVVNIASQCGYTPQLGPLQKLDSLYEGYGFEVLGFPCNNFANQEPLPDSGIANFCENNYNVHFQLMHKINIVAGDTAPVYKWLQRKALNGVANASVTWNFNKFLIDRQGKWVKRFTQITSPLDTAITNWIKRPEVTENQSRFNSADFKLNKNPVSTSDPIVCQIPTGFMPVSVQLVDALGRKQNIKWELNQDQLTCIPKNLSAQHYWLRINSSSNVQIVRVLVEK